MTEWMGTISMKRTRKLRYLFKEGVRNMLTHGFMSFAAVCVTVACLVIIGSCAAILYNVAKIVDSLGEKNQIIVFIDQERSLQEARQVESAIRQLDNIREANFVSREERVQRYIEGNGESDVFAGIDPSSLRHRVDVTLEDNGKMDETVKAIRQLNGVAGVRAVEELARGFATIQKILLYTSIGIIAVLLVVSLFMISNTIKLAMYDRRDEIAIMKMIGATDRFIRFPYFVEGFLIGVLSGVLAFGIEWGLYDLLSNVIRSVNSGVRMIDVVPFRELLLPMAVCFGAASLVIGIFGSVMSIRKFLDV